MASSRRLQKVSVSRIFRCPFVHCAGARRSAQLGHEVLQDNRIRQSLAVDWSSDAGKLDNTNAMRRKHTEPNVLELQDREPYNKGAYKVKFEFPAEYPFKPPTVTFLTKIYHPNIDEKGQVCLPIVSVEHWKPATKTEQGKTNVFAYCHAQSMQ